MHDPMMITAMHVDGRLSALRVALDTLDAEGACMAVVNGQPVARVSLWRSASDPGETWIEIETG